MLTACHQCTYLVLAYLHRSPLHACSLHVIDGAQTLGVMSISEAHPGAFLMQGSCSDLGNGDIHEALNKAFLGHAGKLVTVKGVVIRASPIRQLIHSMEYACTKCGCRQRCTFPDGATTRPLTCSNGCRSRAFTPILDSARTAAWQRIRLQVGIIS